MINPELIVRDFSLANIYAIIIRTNQTPPARHMPHSLPLFITTFLFGAIIQAALLIRQRISAAKMFFLLISCGLGFYLISLINLQRPEWLAASAALWLGYFVFSFPLVFKTEVLPVISRRSLIGLTAVFWYAYILSLSQYPLLGGLIIILPLIMSAGALVIALSNWPIFHGWRIFCYAWFLLMLVFFCWYHLQYPPLVFLFHTQPMPLPGLAESLVLGMAVFYLLIHVWYIVELLPLSLLHRLKPTHYAIWEWQVKNKILGFKYHNEAVTMPLDVLIVAGICLLALLANHHYGWFSDIFVLDVLFLWLVSLSPNTQWAFL